MSAEKATALVLRAVDFSDTSKVITLFTRETGKISALAKGAKRLKGPFDSALDVLSQCHVVFLRKSGTSLHLLTEAKLEKRFAPQGPELNRLYGGYYVAELLTGLTQDDDPHPALFQAACDGLRALENAPDPLCSLLSFEHQLLLEIGLLPAFDHCLCGRETVGEQSAASSAFAFWVTQGLLLCEHCQRPDVTSRKYPAAAIHWLHSLTEGTADSSHPPSGNVLRAGHELLVSCICQALDHKPRTLRYLSF